MRRIYYLKELDRTNLDKYLPELKGSTLIIYHDFYEINTKYNSIKWSEFKATYANYEVDNLIIVGMNRIRTSESRYDLVYSYIYRMNEYKFKAVFDEKPFNGEPWRVWYHYGFLYGKWLDVDYSHPLETEWKKWFYYDKNTCKVCGEYLPVFIKDTYSELNELQTEFEFYEPDKLHIEFYEESKKIVFEKFDTPKLLIHNLLKICNKHFDLDINYESYLTNKKYILPDFRVYKFMIEENRRRKEIYNCFTHEKLGKKY